MAAGLLHVSATILCPHGAQAQLTTSNARVKVGGLAVAVAGDSAAVAGCPFQVPIGTGTKPQPCVKVLWTTPATRVRVGGQPALLSTSSAVCQSAEQAPQGAPSVVAQLRAKGV